jgi:predicted TIM-barrel fold metal-dependent hydrolase
MAVDVHAHFYLPEYVELLRGRTEVPRIVQEDGTDRFLIVPQEAASGRGGGRPMDDSYWNIAGTLDHMAQHGIDVTVLSLGNPWLDFLEADAAAAWAPRLNQALARLCAQHPGRLYGLGVLPLQTPERAARELDHLSGLPGLRGAIISTRGAGHGLDDRALDPVWQRAEALELALFVHPHYGIGMDPLGPHAYALNFALGFLFETTIAVARLILGGVLDRHPRLRLLVAHGGGTLPYLAGRLDNAARAFVPGLERLPSEHLQRLSYDVTVYHGAAVHCALEFVGPDHLMFGTDHPFRRNPSAVYRSLADLPAAAREAVLNRTARAFFRLAEP